MTKVIDHSWGAQDEPTGTGVPVVKPLPYHPGSAGIIVADRLALGPNMVKELERLGWLVIMKKPGREVIVLPAPNWETSQWNEASQWGMGTARSGR